jgi:hypothetical protein
MDAEGARELTRRIGANARVAIRPVPEDVSPGALPLVRWFGVCAAVAAAEASQPAKRPARRRAARAS